MFERAFQVNTTETSKVICSPRDCATAGSIRGIFMSSTLPAFRSELLGRSIRRRSWNITVPAHRISTNSAQRNGTWQI